MDLNEFLQVLFKSPKYVHRKVYPILLFRYTKKYFLMGLLPESTLTSICIFSDHGLNMYFPLVNGWLEVILWYKGMHTFKPLLQ
jgi:hypothetical protein